MCQVISRTWSTSTIHFVGIRTLDLDLELSNEVKLQLGWFLVREDNHVVGDVHLVLVAGREADPPPQPGQPAPRGQEPKRIRQRIGQRIEHPEPIPIRAERSPEIEDTLFRADVDGCDDDDVRNVENVAGQ